MISLRDRIVVTGIGLTSPLGSDLDYFLKNLTAATPPIHDGHAAFTGCIEDFGPVSQQTKRLIRKSLKLMNRETQLGVAAAQKAIEGSGILTACYESDRIGVCFGAGNVEIRRDDFVSGMDACRQAVGEFDPADWGQFGVSHVDPLWILRVLPNMPACHTAIANDFRGPNNTITQADVATNMAINEARFAILDGDADAMIVGGTGTGFVEPARLSDESSVQPAEAAAAFVLERMESAIDRGAPLLGEILAAAAATMIEPDHRANPQAAGKASVAAALAQAGIAADAVAVTNSEAISRRIGNAAAGTSALEIAAILLSRRTVIHVSTMDNGLASCVVIGGKDIATGAAA